MPRSRLVWTFLITSVAAFMVSLDNLVVTMALPSIRAHLHAGLSGLEWTVNAYTLTFAVLILTGSSLGDRFGAGGCSAPAWLCLPWPARPPPWRPT
ncbi:MAG: hypothetical protein ACRDY0_09855 [Acidimicrobiales bacterium]